MIMDKNLGTKSTTSKAAIDSSNVMAILDAGADVSGRKKSGFVITRVDKSQHNSSTGAIAENNESDLENDVLAVNTPGSSSSVVSEASTIDDRPFNNVSRAPPPTPAGATPTSPAWPTSTTVNHGHHHHQKPVGLTAIITANSAAAGAAALLSAAASLQANPQARVLITANSPSSSSSSQSPSAVPPHVPSTITRETSGGSSSSSRFHIIKIETGPYKRGRWNCRDFDESNTTTNISGGGRSDMIAVGPPPRPGSSGDSSSGRPSLHLVEENGHELLLLSAANTQHAPPSASSPPTAKPPTKSSSSSIAQHLHQQRSHSPAPPPPLSRFQVRPAGVDLNNAAAAILDSIVGSMQADTNRQRHPSTTTTTSALVSTTTPGGAQTTAIASVVDGPIGGGSSGMGQVALAPGSVGANVVAIDNKIEQAMDLVKTHLLYAVREEVEVLKEKIIDLERKVFRLETENKLLREYAPPEILQQIQHQQQQSHSHPLHLAAPLVNGAITGGPSSAPPPVHHPLHQQQQAIVGQHPSSASTVASLPLGGNAHFGFGQPSAAPSSNSTTSTSQQHPHS